MGPKKRKLSTDSDEDYREGPKKQSKKSSTTQRVTPQGSTNISPLSEEPVSGREPTVPVTASTGEPTDNPGTDVPSSEPQVAKPPISPTAGSVLLESGSSAIATALSKAIEKYEKISWKNLNKLASEKGFKRWRTIHGDPDQSVKNKRKYLSHLEVGLIVEPAKNRSHTLQGTGADISALSAEQHVELQKKMKKYLRKDISSSSLHTLARKQGFTKWNEDLSEEFRSNTKESYAKYLGLKEMGLQPQPVKLQEIRPLTPRELNGLTLAMQKYLDQAIDSPELAADSSRRGFYHFRARMEFKAQPGSNWNTSNYHELRARYLAALDLKIDIERVDPQASLPDFVPPQPISPQTQAAKDLNKARTAAVEKILKLSYREIKKLAQQEGYAFRNEQKEWVPIYAPVLAGFLLDKEAARESISPDIKIARDLYLETYPYQSWHKAWQLARHRGILVDLPELDVRFPPRIKIATWLAEKDKKDKQQASNPLRGEQQNLYDYFMSLRNMDLQILARSYGYYLQRDELGNMLPSWSYAISKWLTDKKLQDPEITLKEFCKLIEPTKSTRGDLCSKITGEDPAGLYQPSSNVAGSAFENDSNKDLSDASSEYSDEDPEDDEVDDKLYEPLSDDSPDSNAPESEGPSPVSTCPPSPSSEGSPIPVPRRSIPPLVGDSLSPTRGKSRKVVDIFPILRLPFHRDQDLRKLARKMRKQKGIRFRNGTKTGLHYFYLSNRELRQIVRDRRRLPNSMVTAEGKWPKETVINWLQIDDAIEGIDPAMDPNLISKYHRMNIMAVLNLAYSKGFRYGKRDKLEAIAYLLRVDPSGTIELTQEESDAIGRLIGDDFAASVQVPQSAQGEVPESAGSMTGGTSRQYVTTWNRGLYGLPAAMSNLEGYVAEGFQPEPTSNVGYLCAVRAYASSLFQARVLRNRQLGLEYPTRISHDEIMSLLFDNYNPQEANNPDIVPDLEVIERPTPMFATFLEQRFQHLIQDNGERSAFDEEMRTALASANMGLEQLILITAFLADLGVIETEFAIGVVTDQRDVIRNGTEVRIPPIATIHSLQDPEAPVLWLYNTNTEDISSEDNEVQELGHWEGFVPHGGGRANMLRWGLELPGAGELPAKRFSHWDKDTEETPEEKAIREHSNTMCRVAKEKRDFRSSCNRCRDRRIKKCDGVIGTTCTSCKDAGEECSFPSHVVKKPQWIPASNLTEWDLLPWEGRNPDSEALDYLRHQAIPDPEPISEHFLVIASGRMSTNTGPQELGRLIQNLPVSARTYESFLRSPHMSGRLQEGYLPAPLMRLTITPFCRQGTRPLPWALGNNPDPFLRALVTLFFDNQTGLTRPQNPQQPHVVPEEIHFLLNGIAGSSVDITGFGNYHRGFFRKILDADQANGTNIADRIYIVPHVQPHVVDGVSPHSLNFPVPSANWHGHRGQYITKRKLKSLIDRIDVNEQNDRNRILLGLPPIPRAVHLDAHWDDDQRNDEFLAASAAEHAWRAGGLDGTTAPTEQEVQMRNAGRNNVWI